jgi:hypothetical protein
LNVIDILTILNLLREMRIWLFLSASSASLYF